MNDGKRLVKISKAAAILGVSAGCLRRWENEGKIAAIRTPGNQRLLDLSSVFESDVAKELNRTSKRVVFYARVSSAKQKDDLERQKKYIREHHSVKCAQPDDVLEVSDVGSGLNFKRPGLLRVLRLVKEGNVSKVVVASRDRMARFGYELIEWMCREFGTEVLVLDQEDSTPEEELGKDLMSIVQVYCCRWNGKRRYASLKNKGDEAEVESDSSAEGSSSPDGGSV
jgi:putative resolvase